MLIKFLAARKFKLEEAQKFLNDRIEFMAKHNLDRPLTPETEFPNEIEDAPVVIHKCDLYGRPIVYN